MATKSRKRSLESASGCKADKLEFDPVQASPAKKRKVDESEIKSTEDAKVPSMNDLITVTCAADVTDEYKKTAQKWNIWDSKSQKKFPYNYKMEERVLIIKGNAILTPSDGSNAIHIGAGDAVTFHAGFKCKWEITKRMKKYYATFSAEGDEDIDIPAISCDICDADCFAESYFVQEGELDICVACYNKDKEKYKDAEHQKNGEKWVKE